MYEHLPRIARYALVGTKLLGALALTQGCAPPVENKSKIEEVRLVQIVPPVPTLIKSPEIPSAYEEDKRRLKDFLKSIPQLKATDNTFEGLGLSYEISPAIEIGIEKGMVFFSPPFDRNMTLMRRSLPLPEAEVIDKLTNFAEIDYALNLTVLNMETGEKRVWAVQSPEKAVQIPQRDKPSSKWRFTTKSITTKEGRETTFIVKKPAAPRQPA